MCKNFPKLKPLGRNVKVDLDLSSYATKCVFKKLTGIDTSIFAQNFDLATSKSNVDKLDIG